MCFPLCLWLKLDVMAPGFSGSFDSLGVIWLPLCVQLNDFSSVTRGRLFCPNIKAKLPLWGENRANLRLTAEINEDGWEEVWNIYDEKQLSAVASWLSLLVLWSEMLRPGYPGPNAAFDVFDFCYYGAPTARLLLWVSHQEQAWTWLMCTITEAFSYFQVFHTAAQPRQRWISVSLLTPLLHLAEHQIAATQQTRRICACCTS